VYCALSAVPHAQESQSRAVAATADACFHDVGVEDDSLLSCAL